MWVGLGGVVWSGVCPPVVGRVLLRLLNMDLKEYEEGGAVGKAKVFGEEAGELGMMGQV